jgi:hypothetical protein
MHGALLWNKNVFRAGRRVCSALAALGGSRRGSSVWEKARGFGRQVKETTIFFHRRNGHRQQRNGLRLLDHCIAI